MRNLLRRRRAADGPDDPAIDDALASLTHAGLVAAEPAKVEREPVIHLRYGTTALPPTACGKWVAAAWITDQASGVSCGACKRTVLYKTAAGREREC